MAIRVAINGYDSLEQIAVGGMAAVYRARKISIDKTVAIKVLFPYLATDESYIERFQREAKAAASIQHENIVNVIDFGESEGSFFIVMEYYDGCTLDQLMVDRPGLPTDIAIQILLEVAYGLEAAHRLDIVHRDIKPANVIYTNQGGVKIADFGLARKSDSASMITQHGKVIGTPAYMSPEQAAGRPVGPTSDIFSFGVVAYELLTRRKPFDGKSYSEVLEKIQTQSPTPLSSINPLLAPEFDEIIERALAKEENQRFANAGELIAALESAMEKNDIPRDRRRLVSYARDPQQYDAEFAEKTIAQCLSRGAAFMQKGNSHMKEAVLEYRRILFVDPDNERARDNLVKLQKEIGGSERTQTIDAVAVSAKPASGRARRQPPVKRRRASAWAYLASAVVLAGVGLAWLLTPNHPGAGDAAQQMTRQSEIGDSTPIEHGGSFSDRVDSLLAISQQVKQPAVPSPEAVPQTMSSAMSGPQTRPVVDPPAVTKKSKPDVSVPAARDRNMSREPSRAASSDSAGVAKPAPGALSVYFLGGVGELWVDGQLFVRQPPFDRASIEAGTHRIVCKMSGDDARKELTITIRSGQETVIEYEVGGRPVVVNR